MFSRDDMKVKDRNSKGTSYWGMPFLLFLVLIGIFLYLFQEPLLELTGWNHQAGGSEQTSQENRNVSDEQQAPDYVGQVREVLQEAEQLVRREQFEDALQRIKRMEELKQRVRLPEHPGLMNRYQALRVELKAFASARKRVRQAEEAENNGRMQKAAELYEQAASRVPGTQRSGRYRENSERLRYHYHLNRAESLLDSDEISFQDVREHLTEARSVRETEEVKSLFARLESRMEKAERTRKQTRIRDLLDRAESLAEENQFQSAIDHLDRARQFAPDILEQERKELRDEISTEWDQNKQLYATWEERAFQALVNENWEDALEYAKNAREYLPERSEPREIIRRAEDKLLFGEMVRISAGEYTIGSEEVDRGKRTVLLDAYYIDKYPVTNREYSRFIEETDYGAPPSWDRTYPEGKGDHPVSGVTLEEAKAYAQWAGKSLPTEEQWEVAARGRSAYMYPWGNQKDGARANTVEAGNGDTVPVDHYDSSQSPWGLHQMVGNVSEWTRTQVDVSSAEDDAGSGGTYYVLKGGSYLFNRERSRPDRRLILRAGVRVPAVGFRCVKEDTNQEE